MISSLTGDILVGAYFILRFLHVFAGLVWIGLLYYFNFVQGAFLNETDANAKSQVVQKLVPRALWWFRYAALWTFLIGLTLLSLRAHQEASGGALSFATPYWINILTGSLLGTLMFLNVWLIIWPNQKIVIANAVETAKGGAANPAAAAAGARATVASRTNTLFSIPMLFYMLGASHLGFEVGEGSSVGAYWAVVFVLIGAIEVNAVVGKPGPMATVKGVIGCGFGLLLGMIVLNSILM